MYTLTSHIATTKYVSKSIYNNCKGCKDVQIPMSYGYHWVAKVVVYYLTKAVC